MTRLAALLVAAVLVTAAAPAAALAQNDLLPPAAGTPTAAPTAVPTAAPTPSSSNAQTSRSTLWIIGIGLLVVFVGIGTWIARDARRAIPKDHHHRRSTAEPLPADGAPRPRSPQVKERARARTKAQRRARRHNRPRR